MAQPHALVIDDEPDTTTYLAALLGDHGWRVSTANSANDGLALAQKDAPDIVLLDVMMPERGGLSTLIALRKDPKTSQVPVVLVTGIQEQLTHDFGNFLDRFKHYHPDAYLDKPIDPEQLLRTLEELRSKPPG
ncbi:MAG TPA: response regulator [Vicinamibacteria bacterium]|nr:response regulator [Vicinamibacteria bacterium]